MPRLFTCLAAAGALLLSSLAARAQSKPRAQASATHPVAAPPAQQPKDRGSVGLSLGYGSNSAFFGRTQATAFPYLTQELSYTSPVGLWASVFNYDLFDTDSHFDETDFSIGFDKDLTKRIDASLSYSHFIFAPNSPLVKSAVNNSIDGSLGYDWGILYTRLNGSHLFGPSVQDVFVILDNSRAFDFDGIFTADDYVTFTPKLSLTAGTQEFIETSVQQQIARGNKKPKKNPPTPAPPVVTSTESTRFAFLSYGLRLPVSYNLGKVSVEGAYRYLQPVNVLPEDDSSGRSYFTATLTVTL